jgi:hypothetical protein
VETYYGVCLCVLQIGTKGKGGGIYRVLGLVSPTWPRHFRGGGRSGGQLVAG